MNRVLITGTAGTGKSTVILALAARGHKAVDLDSDEWFYWVPTAGDNPFGLPANAESIWQHRDWVWREDRVARLLSANDTDVPFVGGTAANQVKFYPQFNHIVLLTAPTSVLLERLSSRTNNEYGKDPHEVARVLRHVETVEPLLRRAASLEVDTSVPLDHVVQIVEDVVGNGLSN